MKKIKILALCDSPTSATGFAQVSRNVLRGLAKTGKYDIDVMGINYYGDYYDRETHPYNIYPAMPQGFQDVYGRERFIAALTSNLETSGLKAPWDLVFTIQDSFVLEGMGLNFPFAEQIKVCQELWKRSIPPEHWFKWIAYFPVDSELKENWVTRAIAIPDYPVAYCDWGKEKILEFDRPDLKMSFKVGLKDGDGKKKATIQIPLIKDRIQVIHHGVDLKTFYPISEDKKKEFRKTFFKDKVKDDTFLVVNISRNQPRKDLARTMKAFALFKDREPNSHLYLHCKPDDVGGSIDEMARNFHLVPGEDYTVPQNFNEGIGYTLDVVNSIYNVADLCVTTTLGEGWGFITTEAMACKTPILAPNITSIIDIFDSRDFDYSEHQLETGQLRGIPVKSGFNNSEWICLGLGDNERVRPLTNVDDMVEKMLWVKNNPIATRVIVERAYKWVQGLTWDTIVSQWEKVFDTAYEALEKDRELAKKIDTARRNDPCPCGSGKKFKHCHASETNLDKYKDWLEGDEK
jgi:glycosyltransferase involved in cell wall biosynthesis